MDWLFLCLKTAFYYERRRENVMDQFDLFDFLDMLDQVSNIDQETKVLGKTTDAINYLERGEKILSLLRKKKHKEFKEHDLLEAFRSKSYAKLSETYNKYNYLVNMAAKVLGNKWVQECTNESDNYQEFIKRYLDLDVTVKKHKCTDSCYMILEAVVKKPISGCISFFLDGKTYYTTLGENSLTKRKSGKEWFYNDARSTRYRLIDIGFRFAARYLLIELKRKLKESVEGVDFNMKSDNRIVRLIYDYMFSKFKSYLEKDGIVPLKQDVLEQDYITNFLEVNNIPCLKGKRGFGESDFLPLWFLSDQPLCKTYFSQNAAFIDSLFELLYEVYQDEKETNSILDGLSKEYAKAYQTKKNIPEKMLVAMKQSEFNQYFDYVEFDAECDMDKIIEIEKEFHALQREIFHQNGKLENISIRFRKLGHYKAAGLYFPYLKCLCVDVRCPSSLAHEYGHLLDYENGSISKGEKFHKVTVLYRDLLEKYIAGLPKDDPLAIRWNGNTKYNKSYYTNTSEIFARCLELYLVSIRLVRNSLVVLDEGFAYPKEKSLLTEIEIFFNEFL